jgi:Zn-finger nucleic acid-binding protein
MSVKCPNCSGEMREIKKYNAHVDYCPVCNGVWLDRGEIDKLIMAAPVSGGVEGQPASRGYELGRVLSELRDEGRIS